MEMKFARTLHASINRQYTANEGHVYTCIPIALFDPFYLRALVFQVKPYHHKGKT